MDDDDARHRQFSRLIDPLIAFGQVWIVRHDLVADDREIGPTRTPPMQSATVPPRITSASAIRRSF